MEIVSPHLLFSDELDLFLGDLKIQLKFVGGHSPATISIYVPSEGVLFAGDNIENECHPSMIGARFDILLKILKKIEEMNIEYIIPGHGPVGNRELATKQRRYYEEMWEYTKNLKDSGTGKEEITRRVVKHMLTYLPVPDEEAKSAMEMVMT
ncbi:MAG: hypothetical protein GTN68_28725, partial [Candidatus Aminicenantes bacterium]|nr:hypothetical protein [Candidatus Aminicenantes bacterium]